MSHIYAQEPISKGINARALSLGAIGVAAAFALLPVLLKIPNPFQPPPVTTPDEIPNPAPPFDIPKPPPPPPKRDKMQVKDLEIPPPPVDLNLLEIFLNPSQTGAGVYVDIGKTFLDESDTAIVDFLPSELDQQPRALVATTPIYPYSMQQSKTKGEVMVEFVIDENGRVLRPRVIKSTHRAFEQAALDAVMKSKWQPGRKNGKDVRTLVHLPVMFQP